jgi:LPXTG-motif cell wall-anchored protein
MGTGVLVALGAVLLGAGLVYVSVRKRKRFVA